MKRVWVFILCCVFLIASVSASVVVENISVVEEYSPGANVAGDVNLTIKNEPVDLILSSDFGEIDFREFLKLNGEELDCEEFDCVDVYVASNGATSKNLDLSSGGKYFGFKFVGDSVIINNINFNLSSDFDEGDEVPLRLKFFDGLDWNFNSFSSVYDRSEDWGCYDKTATLVERVVGGLRYCEKISLPNTGSVLMGAEISGAGNDDLKIELLDENAAQVAYCTFEADEGSSCIINGSFEAGVYYSCLSSADGSVTGYIVNAEVSGPKCGYLGSVGGNSSIDYGLYVKTPRYNDAGNLGIRDDEFVEFVSYANAYIEGVYGDDCSDGCVLPIYVSGVDQNLVVSGVDISYSDETGLRTETKIYDLSKEKRKFDFNGSLDLEKAGFDVGNAGDKDLEIYLGSKKLYGGEIEVLPAPLIKSLWPLDPAAGVGVYFSLTVSVEDGSEVQKVEWNFGDGVSVETNQTYVKHAYGNVSKTYNLQVKVYDDEGRSSTKNFSVFTISPKDSLDGVISLKRSYLNNFLDELKVFDSWLVNEFKSRLRVNQVVDVLDGFESSKAAATKSADYVDIALDLYSYFVLRDVVIKERVKGRFLVNADDVDPSIVEGVSGQVSGEIEDYKAAIAEWMREKIKVDVDKQKVNFVNENSEVVDTVYVYDLDFDLKGTGENYFVVLADKNDLIFENADVRDVNGASVVILKSNGKLSFYSDDEVVMFVSPALNKLPAVVLGPCDSDGKCESDRGETKDNCLSDCGNVFAASWWVYLILVILFLVLYGLLQYWYKVRYEKYLFGDRRDLFNILAFIDNAKQLGLKEDEIRKRLRENKWGGEQISYAIHKSAGKRTGMFELIPIEWFMSLRRTSLAKKRVVGMSRAGLRAPGRF